MQSLGVKLANHFASVGETACILHIFNSIKFGFVRRRFLLQNIDKLEVVWLRPYSVDDGKQEFSLCKILA